LLDVERDELMLNVGLIPASTLVGSNVRYWHLADIEPAPIDVRFRG